MENEDSDDAAAEGTQWQLDAPHRVQMSQSSNSLLLQGAHAFDGSSSGSGDEDNGDESDGDDTDTVGRGAISITLPPKMEEPLQTDQHEQPSRVIVVTPHDSIRSVMHDVGHAHRTVRHCRGEGVERTGEGGREGSRCSAKRDGMGGRGAKER